MEVFKRFEPLWLALVVIGGLNWAMIGLFDENVISNVFGGGTTTDVIYTVIGFAALTLVPALFERMHVDVHMPRTHHS